MKCLLIVDCAMLLLLCMPTSVSSGEDDYDPCKAAAFVNGDIAISREDLIHTRRTKRAATSLRSRHWKHGIIPYKIDTIFTGDQKSIILQAMRHWENNSCLTFVEHSKERDYIFFYRGTCGCCSFVGRRGNGKQGISVGHNCDKFGIIVHELGHVVGFWHEHTRPDRDHFVRIITKNIKKGEEHNFLKMKDAEINSYGEKYDFESIMHYAPNAFSKKLISVTIFPRRNLSNYILPNIGQRKHLSKGDIDQVNKMYKCTRCGGTLQKPFGTLTSPGYPKNSLKPYTCIWRISANSGEAIVLTAKDFDLRSSRNCETDFVEIRDGHSSSSKLVGRYCGKNKPPREITSTESRLWIKLRLRGLSKTKGFLFNYKAVCGGTIKMNKGKIQSPNFPANYEFNKNCIWKIVVKKGTKVGIKFSSFDVEQDQRCDFDSLTIYDGPSRSSPMLHKLCGIELPGNVISSSNEMLVNFKSDNSVTRKGFMLNFFSEVDECVDSNGGCEQICRNTLGSYECDCFRGYELHSDGKQCEAACGGELKDKNGTITSPSYPDKYPKNKKCLWAIRAPPLHQIKLKFHDFEVEKNGEGCKYDYLVVKNRKNTTRLCGDKVPDVMMSTSNEMDLEFHSDNSMSLKGFSASYYTDKDECQENNGGCEQKCVNTDGSYLCKCRLGYKLDTGKHKCVEDAGQRVLLQAPTGVIKSPNFPLEYGRNLDLTWKILVTPGHCVKLTFKEIDIEYAKNCIFDYVEIHSGFSTSSELLGKVCGKNASRLQPFISKSHEMQLKFHSDHIQTAKGFESVYETVCGGRLNAESKPSHIYSHVDFPKKPYPANTRCGWHLAAKSGFAIKIKFLQFELEEEEGCTYDYLNVKDGSDNAARSLGQICGSQSGRKFFSTSNNMWLQFVTDGTKGMKGFLIEYSRVKL